MTGEARIEITGMIAGYEGQKTREKMMRDGGVSARVVMLCT